MSLIRNVLYHLSGGASRNIGEQSGAPSGYANASAVPVTIDTAMQLSAVWACVRVITESIGSLPINVYKLSDGGIKTPFPDHPLSMLLRNKPNRWQTRQEYIESLVYQFVMQGNDYSAVQRDSKGNLISLVPLMTQQMRVELLDSGAVKYEYQSNKGKKLYNSDNLWHNKLYGNAIIGLSPLGHARNSFGIASAAEQSVTKIYKNGGKPAGILTIDKPLKPDQKNTVRENFKSLTEGEDNRLFVLEAGFNYTQTSLSPSDIELLESRKFQIEDICRFFNVPSVLVNDTSQSTAWGSGIEQLIQGFYKFGLNPYVCRYKDSMKANLLNPLERDTMAIEFDLNALLRPDMNERIKGYGEGIQKGVMMPNEARKLEGLAPVEGGDNLFMQQQMAPINILETMERKGISNEPAKDKE